MAHLTDGYKFPGFITMKTVLQDTSDPQTRIIHLKRKQKKLFVILQKNL